MTQKLKPSKFIYLRQGNDYVYRTHDELADDVHENEVVEIYELKAKKKAYRDPIKFK